jgi:hypothetical protein
MIPESQRLAALAQPVALQLAQKLARLLQARGIATDIGETPTGYDVRLKNHGTAAEYGTRARMAQPVVRTTLVDLRTGDTQ